MRNRCPTPSRPAVALGLALLVLALAGPACFGRSPQPREFTLQGVDGPVVERPERPLTLQIGPPALPRYLDAPDMVRRGPGGEILRIDFRRWAGGFGPNLLRALANNLAQRLDTSRIAAHPIDPLGPLDYRLRLVVDELIREDSGELALAVRWSIRRPRHDESAIGSFQTTEPVSGDGVQALIAAHERALGRLSDAIALSLAERERQREAAEAEPAAAAPEAGADPGAGGGSG